MPDNYPKYFIDETNDKIIKVDNINVSQSGSGNNTEIFCSTTAYYFYRKNSVDKHTNQFTKNTSKNISEKYRLASDVDTYFLMKIKRDTESTKEIDETTFNEMRLNYNNQP